MLPKNSVEPYLFQTPRPPVGPGMLLFLQGAICAGSLQWYRYNSQHGKSFTNGLLSLAMITICASWAVWCFIWLLKTPGFPFSALAFLIFVSQSCTLLLVAVLFAILFGRKHLHRTRLFYVAVFFSTYGGYYLFYAPLTPVVSTPIFSRLVLTFLMTGAGLLVSLLKDEIEVAERFSWRWNKVVAAWVFACMSIVFTVQFCIRELEWANLQLCLLISVISALMTGILCGFSRAENIEGRLTPNQGVRQSLRVTITLASLCGVGGSLLAVLTVFIRIAWTGDLTEGSVMVHSILMFGPCSPRSVQGSSATGL